jgi:hydrogenase nickel incorporation protein HypA/HybF
MHELAIADAIVAIAADHARGRRVHAVQVATGQLRQVVPSALAFAFELVAQDTAVAGARLELRVVPARVRCRVCEAESEQDDFPLSCRACGAIDVEVVAGEELVVEALEIEEEAEVMLHGR